MSMTRLLIEGGTPLLAMHRYGPMCSRETFDIVKFSPSTTFTVYKIKELRKDDELSNISS